MQIRMWMGAVSALLAATSAGRCGEAAPPPGAETALVVVNPQQSLRDAVGEGFPDQAWESPAGLSPKAFSGLRCVRGPSDSGLSPKARWRRPIVMIHKTAGVKLNVNCYRRREGKRADAAPGTPSATLLEPDYEYQKCKFHGLPAATASMGNRYASVFRDGDLLFEIEAIGGKAQARRETVAAVAEEIWTFHHAK